MTVRPYGMPAAVVERARRAGAHNDCLLAGMQNACKPCVAIVMAALHVQYAALPATEVVQVAFDQMMDDIEAVEE